jgi:hypothetical protein
MPSKPEDQQPQTEEYESPEVEEVAAEAGPAVTAAGDSPQDVAISLVEDDE